MAGVEDGQSSTAITVGTGGAFPDDWNSRAVQAYVARRKADHAHNLSHHLAAVSKITGEDPFETVKDTAGFERWGQSARDVPPDDEPLAGVWEAALLALSEDDPQRRRILKIAEQLGSEEAAAFLLGARLVRRDGSPIRHHPFHLYPKRRRPVAVGSLFARLHPSSRMPRFRIGETRALDRLKEIGLVETQWKSLGLPAVIVGPLAMTIAVFAYAVFVQEYPLRGAKNSETSTLFFAIFGDTARYSATTQTLIPLMVATVAVGFLIALVQWALLPTLSDDGLKLAQLLDKVRHATRVGPDPDPEPA